VVIWQEIDREERGESAADLAKRSLYGLMGKFGRAKIIEVAGDRR